MANLFRRILVPHDFSAPAGQALAAAADLAAANDGRLTILHVVTPMTPVVEMPAMAMPVQLPPAETIDEAKQTLERMVRRALGRRQVRYELVVEIGDAFHRILEKAKRADLIVMSTAGRTGLAHLLIGSVAEKVVRHSPVPVLTIRPREKPAARRR